jgi:hypothetical protein
MHSKAGAGRMGPISDLLRANAAICFPSLSCNSTNVRVTTKLTELQVVALVDGTDIEAMIEV